MKYTIQILAILFLISSCKKDDPKEEVDKIKAELTLDENKVSEVSLNTTKNGANSYEIIEGENNVEVLNEGNELWFYFNAEAGDVYRVAWQDSWFEEYTAGSIYVTAFEEDKQTTYFDEERLLQMFGSPKIISVGQTGKVYLKVKGYDGEVSGSFSINVESFDTFNTPTFPCDTTLDFIIKAGETQLHKFNVIKDSTYQLICTGSETVGAYGDDVAVKYSVLRRGKNDSYFYDERVIAPIFNNNEVDTVSFTPSENETVFLGLMGAYWWNPRDIQIKLLCPQ